MNFRDLNRASLKDEYVMPIVYILVHIATRHGVLTFMDGHFGYNQILMIKEDVRKNDILLSKCAWNLRLASDAIWIEEHRSYLSKIYEFHIS